MTTEQIKFDKLFSHLNGYLLGAKYHKAIKALQYARKKHSGKRKDGVTPEFMHQVEIALQAITLKNLIDEEKVLIAIFLHDVEEDFDIARSEISLLFGNDNETIVWSLTKKYKGQKKNSEEYFNAIANCPIASIVKGLDRIHNVKSMIGVFSPEKQLNYIKEVNDFFIPMLKKASHEFPEQMLAYRNIIHSLRYQLPVIEACAKAMLGTK